RLEIADERVAVAAPLFGLAEAVELEADVLVFDETELAPERSAHEDELGVDVRAGKAHRFGADLVELPRAALLRPLVAKHGADVEKAFAAIAQERMLGHSADDSGRRLGPERQAIAVHRVFEGIHLLLDDVGHFAEAANEERRRLHDRRAHAGVAIASHQGAQLVLEPLPTRRFP